MACSLHVLKHHCMSDLRIQDKLNTHGDAGHSRRKQSYKKPHILLIRPMSQEKSPFVSIETIQKLFESGANIPPCWSVSAKISQHIVISQNRDINNHLPCEPHRNDLKTSLEVVHPIVRYCQCRSHPSSLQSPTACAYGFSGPLGPCHRWAWV